MSGGGKKSRPRAVRVTRTIGYGSGKKKNQGNRTFESKRQSEEYFSKKTKLSKKKAAEVKKKREARKKAEAEERKKIEVRKKAEARKKVEAEERKKREVKKKAEAVRKKEVTNKHGRFQFTRADKLQDFVCDRCLKPKRSRVFVRWYVAGTDGPATICNGCYGYLLSGSQSD